MSNHPACSSLPCEITQFSDQKRHPETFKQRLVGYMASKFR